MAPQSSKHFQPPRRHDPELPHLTDQSVHENSFPAKTIDWSEKIHCNFAEQNYFRYLPAGFRSIVPHQKNAQVIAADTVNHPRFAAPLVTPPSVADHDASPLGFVQRPPAKALPTEAVNAKKYAREASVDTPPREIRRGPASPVRRPSSSEMW